MPLETDLTTLVDRSFPAPRPPDFELHATELINPRSYYRSRKSLYELLSNHQLAEVRHWQAQNVKSLEATIEREIRRDEEESLGIY
jgi:hypothetical protein